MSDSSRKRKILLDAVLACGVLASVWFFLLKPRLDATRAEIAKQLSAPGNHSFAEVEKAIGLRHDHYLKLPLPKLLQAGSKNGESQSVDAAEFLSSILEASPDKISEPALRYAAWAEKQFSEDLRSVSIGYNEEMPYYEMKDYALAGLENTGVRHPKVLPSLLALTRDRHFDQYRILEIILKEPLPEMRAKSMALLFPFANREVKQRICDELSITGGTSLLSVPAQALCSPKMNETAFASQKPFIERRDRILSSLTEPEAAASILQQMPVKEQIQLIQLFSREPETFRQAIPMFLVLLEKQAETISVVLPILRASAPQCRGVLRGHLSKLEALSAHPEVGVHAWALSVLLTLGRVSEEKYQELPQVLVAASPAMRHEILLSLKDSGENSTGLARLFERAFRESELNLVTGGHGAYLFGRALGATGEEGEKILLQYLTSNNPYLQAAAAENLSLPTTSQSAARKEAQRRIIDMLRTQRLKPWVKASFILSSGGAPPKPYWR